MSRLLKIFVLGFIALGFVACDGSPSCKSGEVKDEVIKKVKSMYPDSNPKLTNISTENSLKEEKVGAQMLECKADISNLDEDILSVNYNVLKLGDKVEVSTRIASSAVAATRSEIANAQRAIVAKVFADNIDTTKPTAPKGKSWGEWIMEINKLDANKWQSTANGVILKDCGGESPLISIDSKGIMHFKPSTLPSDNALCKGLSNSYKGKSGSGDKKIPLASSGTVEFR